MGMGLFISHLWLMTSIRTIHFSVKMDILIMMFDFTGLVITTKMIGLLSLIIIFTSVEMTIPSGASLATTITRILSRIGLHHLSLVAETTMADFDSLEAIKAANNPPLLNTVETATVVFSNRVAMIMSNAIKAAKSQ
jgi:hypothetical protein